jgi:Putative addiction module component
MSSLAIELKNKIADLSRDERFELTCFLLDQLQAEDDPTWRAAWLEELNRREQNPQYVPAEEVFGKYRKPTP